ncbi:hypothetical protein [Pedococcus cremeus]|uniref:hypothetical protein n=1 Tax=Pedococcus cremeus TaxID=587636 RepID=UPI0015A60966|nr:hypothetical protein [Pedococcus cremeus]
MTTRPRREAGSDQAAVGPGLVGRTVVGRWVVGRALVGRAVVGRVVVGVVALVGAGGLAMLRGVVVDVGVVDVAGVVDAVPAPPSEPWPPQAASASRATPATAGPRADHHVLTQPCSWTPLAVGQRPRSPGRAGHPCRPRGIPLLVHLWVSGA